MGRCKSDHLPILCLALALTLTGSTLHGAPIAATWPPSDPTYQLSLSGPSTWVTPSPEPEPPVAVPLSQFLQKGTWDLEFSGTHMWPFKSNRDFINSGSTALGYFIADNFSVNAALVGYSVEQRDNTAFAGGFDLYGRFYFLTLDRLTFYFDAGAGIFMADREVPEHGTHFNFTPRAGFGVGFHLSERVYLLTGARYWHLSNAGIDGRNPSFDSLQFYASIMFTF